MFIKEGYAEEDFIRQLSAEEVKTELASPEIASRLEKHARRVQALAPKSDDFLYFTIIFLKSAESALLDDHGNHKKVGSERAWGYFDNDWAWHGNVKPHKNNNGDIFPEAELKKASRKWIGMPLCVDHKSDTVDGIRGIILDTYYDEKLKQVVGLCALDKINYPDLARKVSTGVVRYGSMGTAVEISICTECPNRATTPSEYCDHIIKRTAWGEVNVGLRPIEYSLVVQPAEPGARLLRCIASIKSHKDELKNYGVEDIDELTNNLSVKQASELERILKAVCGDGGCSLNARRGIMTSYLEHNGFVKAAALNNAQEKEVQFAEALAEIKAASGKTPEDAMSGDAGAYELYAPIYDAFGRRLPTMDGSMNAPAGETITSDELVASEPVKTIIAPGQGVDRDFTGSGGNTSLTSGVTEPTESFEDTGVKVMSENPRSAIASNKLNFDSIIGEIMKESRLRKRAELRRRLAYHQGGADGVEPSGTYKSDPLNEDLRNAKGKDGDKQMFENPKSLGGTDGMVPGDKEVKEKLSRAELEQRLQRRVAYHQGGADGVEPKGTYTSEDYGKYRTPGKDADKILNLNPASTGGTDGMYPGDKEVKEKQQRMAAYKGPALSTKLTQLRRLDGSINKAGSKFEVFAGDHLVIGTTAKDIWGPKLNEEWDYLSSPEYGKDVVAEIRENGLEAVAQLLTKSAQMEEPPPMEEPPIDLPAEGGEELPPMDEAPMLEDEEPAEGDDKAIIEEAFMAIEERMDEIKDAVERLGGGDIDIDVNIGEEGVEAEKLALSMSIFKKLKTVLAESNESADELALLSQTYENFGKLSSKQRTDLKNLSGEAVKDSVELIGESSAFLSMARVVVDSMVKTSTYSEIEGVRPVSNKTPTSVPSAPSSDAAPALEAETSGLVAEAMELRKRRREEILRKAAEKLVSRKQAMESEFTDEDSDGAVNAVEDTNTAADMESSASDPIGGHYDGKPRPLPELSNSADGPDAGDVHEIAEDEAKEEVDKHEERKHSEDETESDALDATSVQAKMKESFIQKKSDEERESYRLKLRRAYDIGMMMQDKSLLARTKSSLERQVDDIMLFDDRAFEAVKRTVANAKPAGSIKIASDLGGINIGVDDDVIEAPRSTVDSLTSMWD